MGGNFADAVSDVAVDGNNVYVGGSFSGSTADFGGTVLTNAGGFGSPDGFLVKLLDNGTSASFTWVRQIGGPGEDGVNQLQVSSGGLYVAGSFTFQLSLGATTLISAGNQDIFVAKFMDAGSSASFVWVRQAGGPSSDYPTGLALNGATLYLAGQFFGSTIGFGATTLTNTATSSYDAFLVKLTDNGSGAAVGWVQQVGGAGNETLLAPTSNGSSLYCTGSFDGSTANISGTTLTSAGLADVLLAKFTDAGANSSLNWAYRAGGSNNEFGNGLAVRGSSVYAAGNFFGQSSFGATVLSAPSNQNIFVTRLTDAGGTAGFDWAQQSQGANGMRTNSLSMNGRQVYVGGKTKSPATFGSITVNGPYSNTDDGLLASLTDGPALTALSPRLATPGTAITLTGTNLTGTTAITFTGAGGQKVVTSGFTVNAAGTQITGVVIPIGAQSGPVTVTTGSGSSASGMGAVFWRANTVAAGAHSLAVRADGTLWAWGNNSNGQLGIGNTTNSTVPVQVGTGANWGSVAVGGAHSVAVRTDGTLWTWGSNSQGQFGNGTTTSSNVPVQVGTGTNWVNVAAGAAHTTALRTDGTLWAWGNNDGGQLGNGTTVRSTVPVQVGSATNWVGLAANWYQILAVRADGTLWAWGNNQGGQLGNGTTSNSSVPGQVGTNANWVSVAAGTTHTLAAQADGTLWAWGFNGQGQLGSGTTGNSTTPIRVGSAATWATIGTGSSHSLAVQANGTLWAWGSNFYGQVGDGTFTNRTSPVQVGTATTWVSLALGTGDHSLAEQSCRAVWAWGNNANGQLGDGTTTQRNSPVQVYNPTVTLTLSPTSAAAGTTVTATGTNLTGLTALTVNGASALASVANNTATGFTFVVPAGATPGVGSVTATTGCGASSSAAFTALALPTLTSLSPSSGATGSPITLNGNNLTGTTTITFAGSSNNTVATGFTVNAAGTQITGVVVPTGATTGNVTVTTGVGTSNGLMFTVTAAPLAITAVSPTNGTSAAATTNNVSVTFDQPVSSGSTTALKVFSAQRGGLRTAGSGTATASGSAVSFAPTYAFRPGETVQATVTTGASSGAGGALASPRVWQFTTAANGGTGTFVPGSDPTVGTAPFSVAAADVNNDGYPDVLSANATDNTVSVRLNNGSGAFAGTTNVPVGTRPFGLVAADVNGDGVLDLLTANQLANTASICLGNGSGGFGGASSVAVGNGPWGVAAADIDGDGDLDLLTANHSTNTVSVRLNNGSGVFSGKTSVTVGSAPFCVVAADVDNDGDLDLATANEGSSTVSLRLNNGSGTFSGTTELPVGNSPQGVVAADLNGDGALDLATANHGGNNVSVLLNNGSGAFGAATAVSSGNYAVSVAAADVDGDGDLDLVTANYGANTVSVRLNNGSGSFTGTGSVAVGAGPTLLVTADVDGDGDQDFLTANQTANTVSVRLNQSATLPDLTISTGTLASPTAVAPGTYNSITVTSTGVAQLTGSTMVNTRVSVSGTLLTNCQALNGTAIFVLNNGATLGICDPDGLSSTPGLGAVRTTGLRSTSPGVSYIYNGTVPQVTGDGLGNGFQVQMQNLTITNPQPVTLSMATRIKETLTIANTGNLVLNGQALTLLSDASGTALVVNSGSGVVQGSTGTMQRYIDASGNTGTSGYRHYSAPVSGSTVADLATSTFTPTLNLQYNSSPTPLAVQAFPTVFGYDETRLTTSAATGLSNFDKGWYSPTALTDPLIVGRGYTVQLGNNELVDFTGTFTTGPQTIGGLTRGSQPDAGWHLVGNPYPAPLDWGTVSSAQLTNVDAAVYLYQSTGAYGGRYRSLVNGVGAGSSLIPAGQGFFVRASTPGATGSIALTNANRSSTFAGQPALQRTTADARPRLRLSLGAGSQPATPATALDDAFVYLQAGATTAFDGAFDAHKLSNPTGYYLASTSTDAVPLPLSVNGRPLPGPADEVIPLWLSAPAGTYTLTATELANFVGTATPYLRDALAGTLTDLSRQPSYSFTVAGGASYAGRFALVLRPAGALAAAPGAALAGALASLYPNPAAAETTLSATGLPAPAATLDAVLLDATGRLVQRAAVPVRQSAARQALPTAGLSAGLYLLRLTVRDAQGQILGDLPTQRLSVQ